jgi:MarR family transcriptional regulator for hemolysin
VTSKLPDLQRTLTQELVVAARQWQRLVHARTGHHNLSGACAGALVMIGRAGGANQVGVAQQLGMEGASLVRLLDRLASSGLIRREEDAHDRRAKKLWLTDAGEALYAELEQDLKALRQEVLSEMSEDELRVVLKLYQQLADMSAKLA